MDMSNPHQNPDGLKVRFQGPERRQVEMQLRSLDQLLPPDHPARIAWKYVESLDLSDYYSKIRAVEGGAGRNPVDPRILLALWLYATLDGVSSARRLTKLCTDHLAYRWICGGVGVNHDLLSKFRNEHPEALDSILAETIAVLMNQGLIRLECVAQDGMRVRASAGKSSFRKQSTLETHLEDARSLVDTLRRASEGEERLDRQEAARLRAAEEQSERLRQAVEEGRQLAEQRKRQQRNDGQEVRTSTTDPEARVMKMADGGYRPAYNVQFATTCDTQIIVGVDVTNSGSDNGRLQPMMDQLEERFGETPDKVLADAGFNSVTDTTALERRGIEVYSPVKSEGKLLGKGEDPYARRPGDTDEYFAFRQRMKTPEARQLYQKRSATAEFPNAGCRNRGLTQFLVRGLKKAKTVATWQAIVHNLRMILCRGWFPALTGGSARA